MKASERAKELYSEGAGVFTPEGAKVLQRAYIHGATDQHKIDIEKATDILNKLLVTFDFCTGWTVTIINQFKQAVEE